MITWALVPARGGSKSIPHKNLVSVGGFPLLDYGVRAAQASGRFDRIVCSTEDDQIADRAHKLGIEVDRRPENLCSDDTAVAEVARELLSRSSEKPDVLALIQPTSPFLRGDHIHQVLDAFEEYPIAQSVQTVTPCPHHFHAWNQRIVDDKLVRFNFSKEREEAYNKQRKPKLFVFGNLVATRASELLSGGSFFTEPSISITIASPYNFDLDGPEDIAVADALLSSGIIDLPHMKIVVKS